MQKEEMSCDAFLLLIVILTCIIQRDGRQCGLLCLLKGSGSVRVPVWNRQVVLFTGGGLGLLCGTAKWVCSQEEVPEES